MVTALREAVFVLLVLDRLSGSGEAISFAALATDLFRRHAFRYGFVRRRLVERACWSKAQPIQEDRDDHIGDRHDRRHRKSPRIRRA
jgi:hypothetical protein